MKLNDAQLACVAAREGSTVCIATAGSGKTTTLIQRFLMMLLHQIPQEDILNLTFTSSAAENMAVKAGIKDAKSIFRTFHSFALSIIDREREYLDFDLCDTIIPVELQNFQLLFDLVKIYPGLSSWESLQAKISEWKRIGVTPDRALEECAHLKEEYYQALAYRDYEIKCREQGWLDFDGVMQEAVNILEKHEDARRRWQRKYIAVDEFQDTDDTQIRLLQLIFSGNIFAVGDENQCHPPGTMVDQTVYGRGSLKEGQSYRAFTTRKTSIENLRDGNYVVSWVKHDARLMKKGRKIRTHRRFYSGPLLCLSTKNKSVEVTPNHEIWVRFIKKALRGSHFVYVMYKEGIGYRVGTSFFKNNEYGNSFAHRAHAEKANAVWILKMFPSKIKARVYETQMSLKYGVPEQTFKMPTGGKPGNRLSQKNINDIFKIVPFQNGENLLRAHGLSSEHALYERGLGKQHQKCHGWFKTKAANILPIFNLLKVPSLERNSSTRIQCMSSREYTGEVYSLDVEKDHTYVANDIPVANCIYEWRSAQPRNLTNFHQFFPGAQKLFLGKNYRSSRQIVEFLKRILPVDNGIGSYMETDNDEGTPPTITKYLDEYEEAEEVLKKAAQDPISSVIIARTNRQLFRYQKACAIKGVKYKFLGKKDYWEQPEIKKLLDFAKKANPPLSVPAEEVLKQIIRDKRLIEIYSRVNRKMESNPVENLNDIVKMAAKKGNLPEFLDWLRRVTHARQNTKGLTLSTVHQAKGKEWDRVFLIGATQGIMPHEDGELHEEHRIFFVGASRAAKELHISFYRSPSMFIPEEDKKRIVDYYDDRAGTLAFQEAALKTFDRD